MTTNILSFILLTAAALPPGVCATDYPVNFPPDQTITNNGRSLNAISISSPLLGGQRVHIGQGEDMLLYHDNSTYCFAVIPGETVTPSFDWTGNWMHGYVYLDREGDGEFSHTLGEHSRIPEGSDVMSFSNYDGYNSVGDKTNNGNVGVNPPSFTIPSDLVPGIYRMRYKVDWNSIDPGGNDANGAIHQQLITTNAGAIADVSVCVIDYKSGLTIIADNGIITSEDGTEIDTENFMAGIPLTVKMTPDEGYLLSSLSVSSHNSIDVPGGFILASGDFKDSSFEVPAILISDNTYTIPGEYMRGEVTLTAKFVESGGEPQEGDYESSLTGEKNPEEGLTAITLNGETMTTLTPEVHHTLTSALAATVGSPLNLSVTYCGNASEIRFYLDCDNNGVFSAVQGECFAKSDTSGCFPEFSLPVLLQTGVYRARIEAVGDCVVDFPLSYREKEGLVRYDILNGYAFTKRGLSLPSSVTYGKEFVFKTRSALEGFEATKLTVRHGLRLEGPETIHGNRQWAEIEIDADDIVTIDAEDIDGNILIYGEYEEMPESEWTVVWSDEFDGDTINTDKWGYSKRYSSTWNKRIAQGGEIPYVNKVNGGSYNSYAIATPAEFASSDNQTIITGAIESQNKFYLTGGRIEAKIRSRAHRGSFPAFWMMPMDGSKGWPICGEIDIWEQIDDNPTTFHTVHTGWTKKSFGNVSQPSPTSSGTSHANQEEWHIYTLEWEKDEYLKWYKDGREVFSYTNPHFSEGNYTESVTWPFAKPFYIIVNQSVGDGGWAADGDVNYEYLTEFDYVRAYQRKEAVDYYSIADGHVSAIEDIIMDSSSEDQEGEPEYFNLQGIRVHSESVTHGIYIERRGNKVRKIVR